MAAIKTLFGATIQCFLALDTAEVARCESATYMTLLHCYCDDGCALEGICRRCAILLSGWNKKSLARKWMSLENSILPLFDFSNTNWNPIKISVFWGSVLEVSLYSIPRYFACPYYYYSPLTDLTFYDHPAEKLKYLFSPLQRRETSLFMPFGALTTFHLINKRNISYAWCPYTIRKQRYLCQGNVKVSVALELAL